MAIENQSIDKRNAIGIWETEKIMIEIKSEARFIIIEMPINH
ncbi:MAG: hypothetical protein ACKVOU_01865 [Cytophagales bacterium]